MPNLMEASEFNFDALEFFNLKIFHLSHPDSIQTKVYQLKWIHNSKLSLSRLNCFIIAASLNLTDIWPIGVDEHYVAYYMWLRIVCVYIWGPNRRKGRRGGGQKVGNVSV